MVIKKPTKQTTKIIKNRSRTMKNKVQTTLTQDEYNHLLALKNYLGFDSMSETISFAIQNEFKRHQASDTYKYYLDEARKSRTL